MQTLQGQDTTGKTKTMTLSCVIEMVLAKTRERNNVRYNPRRENEQSSPMVLLNCEETRHGRL